MRTWRASSTSEQQSALNKNGRSGCRSAALLDDEYSVKRLVLRSRKVLKVKRSVVGSKVNHQTVSAWQSLYAFTLSHHDPSFPSVLRSEPMGTKGGSGEGSKIVHDYQITMGSSRWEGVSEKTSFLRLCRTTFQSIFPSLKGDLGFLSSLTITGL